MKNKRLIKRILVLTAWFLVISGLATLLIAANRKQKQHLCKQILVGIRGSGESFYIEKGDVLNLVQKTAGAGLLQRPLTAIDLARLEKALEANPWLKDAELYLDTKDALHVIVEERVPVARVFNRAGISFYMDSAMARMPLLEKMSIRVPVFTGFTSAKRLDARDSLVMKDIRDIAVYLRSDDFWNAQVGEVDLTAENKFELIPVVGDHVIRIGSADRIDEKLRRLYTFYDQVLSKTGFDRYEALDVAYDGQVVAVKRGPQSLVDSLQLKKNIDALINRSKLQTIDQQMLPMNQNN